MPLQSSYDAPTGDSYPQAYHAVTEILIDFVGQQVRATVATYRTKAAAATGKEPVSQRTFAWGADEVRGKLGALVRRGQTDFQNALMDRPEFAGATVVDAPEVPTPPNQVATDGSGAVVLVGAPPPPSGTAAVVTVGEPAPPGAP